MKKHILNIANILGAAYFILVASLLSVPHQLSSRPTLKLIAIAIAVLGVIVLNKVTGSNSLDAILRRLSVRRVYIICALIMLVIDVVIALYIKYVPVTDAGYMDTICRNFIEGKEIYAGLDELHTNYLERYSNQWGIFIVQSLIYEAAYRVFGYVPRLTLPLMTVAVMQLTYFFMYKLTCRMFKRDIQKMICLILVLIDPVLYGYSVIFYTDMLSMPFVLCSIYLGISALESKAKIRFVLFSCAGALCIGVGYCIKGNIAVIAAALVIYALFTLGIKRSLIFTVAVVAGFAGVKLAEEQIMYYVQAVTEQGVETYGFPMSHWVMMGLQGRGGYDEESFMLTYSQTDIKERNKESVRQIKATLHDYGIRGFSYHIKNKITYTWSDAAYQLTWQMHKTARGGFARSKMYLSACFILQCFMIICMLASYISAAIYRRIDRMFLIRLTVLGLGVFLLIWETRSRYMLNMLPLFFILSVDGLEQLMDISAKIKKRLCS